MKRRKEGVFEFTKILNTSDDDETLRQSMTRDHRGVVKSIGWQKQRR